MLKLISKSNVFRHIPAPTASPPNAPMLNAPLPKATLLSKMTPKSSTVEIVTETEDE